ncbi:MAG: SapC family protein [Desulfotignum sp.]|nr:SapC family protein [Desulfotignum sp.]
MTDLAAVNPKRHAGRSWRRYTSYDFAAKDCIAPLTVAEIASAAKNLPLAFVRQGDNFLLVAVLSLTPGTNLFVGSDGRWLGGYIPSVFRGYPFRLARGGKKNELLLCVDEDSGLVSKDRAGGEVFYDNDGKISGPVTEILNFLTQVEKSRTATAVAVAALADANLLVDWPLKIKVEERDQPVTGLYRVDEARAQPSGRRAVSGDSKGRGPAGCLWPAAVHGQYSDSGKNGQDAGAEGGQGPGHQHHAG